MLQLKGNTVEKQSRASVYRFKDHILVVSLSGKRMFVVESGAYFALHGSAATEAELANTIRQALEKSQDYLFLGVDRTTDFAKASADFLDLMDWFAVEVGAKTKAMAIELELVAVEQIGTEIIFTSQKRDKRNFCFMPKGNSPEDLIRLSSQASDVEIVGAMLRAFG